jgi:hypothetical protein
MIIGTFKAMRKGGGDMNNTAALTTHAHTGVWIDHRQAWIVLLSPEGERTAVILSKVEKHPERAGDSRLKGSYEARQMPANDHRQRALTGDLNGYYDAAGAALRRCDKVLIFGPGGAKGELRARLLKMKLGDHIAAVQTEGQMTEREVVAKVRDYFGLGAPRVQAPQ